MKLNSEAGASVSATLLIATQIERFSLTTKKLYGFHLTYSVKTDNFYVGVNPK